MTRLAKAGFDQVGDQVGQGQGQELDNLQVSNFKKFTGGGVACLITASTPGPDFVTVKARLGFVGLVTR